MSFNPDPKPEPRPKKKRKRIPRESAKRKAQLRRYNETTRPYYLSAHPKCERCLGLSKKDSRKCINESDQIHHKKGRDGELLNNTDYFLACCDPCHKWIEKYPEQSKIDGWSVSRLSL